MVRIDIPTVLVVTGIVPSFRGTDSYLAFPTLLNTYLELNIEVHFKPEMNDGTLSLRYNNSIYIYILFIGNKFDDYIIMILLFKD